MEPVHPSGGDGHFLKVSNRQSDNGKRLRHGVRVTAVPVPWTSAVGEFVACSAVVSGTRSCETRNIHHHEYTILVKNEVREDIRTDDEVGILVPAAFWTEIRAKVKHPFDIRKPRKDDFRRVVMNHIVRGGKSKTTIACLRFPGLQRYAQTDCGALYSELQEIQQKDWLCPQRYITGGDWFGRFVGILVPAACWMEVRIEF